MWEYNYTDELYHHGVKGMKWGQRRYQNFDGSYTRAGMKRFNNSLGEYEKANSRYKAAKKSKSSKTEITNSRLARKKAKRQLNKDYKHLKQDKLADKGKDLYSRGHTITGHSKVTSILSTIGSTSAAVAAYNYKTGMLGDKKVTAILAGAGALSLSVAGIKGAYDNVQDRKLRAYYGHTSNY